MIIIKRIFQLLLLLSIQSAAGAKPLDAAANSRLLAFQSQFEPQLVKMGERVYMAFGFDYSNFAFIEGDDGVIVVDTGWFGGQVDPAIKAFRQISRKPIRAIIYTHVHSDHTGGAQQFIDDVEPGVAIFAHEKWRERIEYDHSSVQPMIARRAFSQMGFVLPPGLEGTIGSGIGPIARANGKSSFIAPTVDVGKRLDLEISGIKLQLIQSPADIQSNLLIWLPEDKVLFSGDVLGGTLPYIATPRFEPDRDPRDFIHTIEVMQEYPAEYIVAGHGRPIIGRNDVVDVLAVNRDIIQFLADQVERYVILGYTADQIIDELELPPGLVDHPDLQPHYHRLDWVIRGLYTKLAGWAADDQELLRLTHSEEAKRLIFLLGGTDKVLDHAENALSNNDPRWAATLANYVVRAKETGRGGRTMRLLTEAYTRIAYMTDSAAERNYLLTAALNIKAPIQWSLFFLSAERRRIASYSSADILATFGPRFSAEKLFGREFVVKVVIEDEPGLHWFHVRNGVLMLSPGNQLSPIGTISLDRTTLVDIATRRSTWAGSLDTGNILIDGDEGVVGELIDALN